MHDLSAKRGHWLGPDGMSDAWTPTHQHRKGGLYRVIADGTWEPDRSPVVIYDDEDGTIWVRPHADFNDGRFTAIDTS